MSKQQILCQYCQTKSPKDELINENENIENKKAKYFHQECFRKELERREKVKIELDKWDSLYDVVKEIHGIDELPRDIITELQDIRNGTKRYRAVKKVGYKEGIDYPVIQKAYDMSRKKIEWVRKNKKFKDVKNEMKYCLAIVKDKLADAKRELKRLEKVDEMYVNPHHSYSEFNVEPVKKFPKS